MKGITVLSRTTIIISLLVVIVLMLTVLVHKQKRKANDITAANEFAGSETCNTCHREISESHVTTAHYLTSRPASEKYIKGSFQPGDNQFRFNDSVVVAMERSDTNFYQVEYINGVQKRKFPIDIVVGSAAKGQSYLYWQHSSLFQLPITYFTNKKQWSNSPGFPGRAVFNRPITSRCLECHTTSVVKFSPGEDEPERFRKNRIIYGVDCEKCHGAAAKHVDFHAKNPAEKMAKFIISPSAFTRQQNLDLCALCHGGRLSKTEPSFSFTAGDKLNEYFTIDTASKDAKDIDVHGNQLGLLASSPCFRKSEMTCNSCHNTHQNERGNLILFSERCLTCHNNDSKKVCKMTASIGNAITKNCIDCHMPKQASKSIAVMLQGSNTPTSALMRTHFIKIYPEETRKFVNNIVKTKGGNRTLIHTAK